MMIKRVFRYTGLLALIAFIGCEEEVNTDALIADEKRYFDLYMSSNYPEVEPTESGLYYIEYKEGTGISPDTGDYILINYLAYTVPDEKVVDTYDEQWARDYNLYNSNVLYGPYKYKHGSEIEGMKEGISMMKEGGVSRLIFKSDLGYGAESLGEIGKFESLMYDIELIEVIKDPVAREKELIDEFLADNLTAYPIKDPETGIKLYYIPGVAGDSIQITDESIVEVFYTGQLLDGRVFDTNAGSTSGMKVTVGAGDVIKGWDLGLKYFRFGGTGKLLIPHELAYGEEGSIVNNTNKTAIPPFEALLFDIEVTKKYYDPKEKE